MSGSQKHRYILGFTDQAVVSFGSLLYLIAAAQSLNPELLGDFSLASASVLLVTSLIRAVGGETFLVRRSEHTRRGAAQVIGLAILLSIVASGILFLIGAIWPNFREVYWATAFALPGIVLQDTLRYVFIGLGHSGRLVSGDIVLVVINASLIWVLGALFRSPPTMVIGWGAGSLLIGAILLIGFSLKIDFRGAKYWLLTGWRFSSAFATEAILGALIGYTTLVVITVFASSSDTAAFRSVVTVFGVTSLIINFLRSTVLRELSVQDKSGRELSRAGLAMSLVTVGTVVGALVALLWLPTQIGINLFGDTWFLLVPLLIPAAMNRAMASLSTVPTVLLRSIGVTWEATKIRLIVTAASCALGPVGAYFGGAYGALIAESFAYLLLLVLLTMLLQSKKKRA